MKPPHHAPAGQPVSRREFLGRLSLGATAWLVLRGRSAAAEPPTRKLGVALVGLGSYSTGQLGPALKLTKHCRLMGVVTRSAEKGRRWAQEYGFPEKNIYHYDTMARLADNPDIDIVYVVTPNSLHPEHVIAAARAGKHVITEKPMANSVAECDAMLAACRKAKVKLSVGYRLHFDPYHQELVRLAREKDFGALTKLTGDFSFVMNGRPWRAIRKFSGGGPIMDLGVYLIQAGCMVAGGVAPLAVTATEGPKTKPEIFQDVEETMTWKMEFAGGVGCDAVASYSHNTDRFRAEGEKGWIELKTNAFMYRGITAETSRGPLVFDPPVNQQARQMDDFTRCVREGRESRVPGEMGRRDLCIVEAIYASAKSGQRTLVKV